MTFDAWPATVPCVIPGCVWRRCARGAPTDWRCPDHDEHREGFDPHPMLEAPHPMPRLPGLLLDTPTTLDPTRVGDH